MNKFAKEMARCAMNAIEYHELTRLDTLFRKRCEEAIELLDPTGITDSEIAQQFADNCLEEQIDVMLEDLSVGCMYGGGEKGREFEIFFQYMFRNIPDHFKSEFYLELAKLYVRKIRDKKEE